MYSSTEPFDLIEASIGEVLDALQNGSITSTVLVEKYLARTQALDRGEDGLNAIVVDNPHALEQAAESDDRWKCGNPRPLEGIPFTVKDSYSVKGLSVAAGSPAFRHLIAGRDAFVVSTLREAGAILIGKTNMPPMADGGMQRGLYGRAESPYNRRYLAAAYASGSSNGSGVATAANLAMFGMGEETVSSGRSPASNNALCAYTPSWGVLSIRGSWPLFPTRDVVVPQTRSMPDMLRILDVLVQDDPVTRGDFWRHQNVIDVPKPSQHRPSSYLSLDDPAVLQGKRFAVPEIYLGQDKDYPLAVRPSIIELWDRARDRLESLGAEVVVTDFPLVDRYEQRRPGRKFSAEDGELPPEWSEFEFEELLAYGWDDFLRVNDDHRIRSLGGVDSRRIFPQPPGTLPDRYERVEDYADRFRSAIERSRRGITDPYSSHLLRLGLRSALRLRGEWYESWLTDHGYDGVVFPANADVGYEDAERNVESADHAWSNGVLFSNGNYALRHLGIPTVTVAMGLMSDIKMPVGLTFAGPAYSDPTLLSFAAAFERGGNGTLRTPPPSHC